MTKKTYRNCVRVLIFKGDKVVLGRRFNLFGTIAHYEFPGGGIEEGETIEEAAVKECLEEVGMAVNDIKLTGHTFKYKFRFARPEYAEKYNGVHETWVACKYVTHDESIHGTRGDGLNYTWETLEDAIRLIESGPNRDQENYKLEVLKSFKNRMNRLTHL